MTMKTTMNSAHTKIKKKHPMKNYALGYLALALMLALAACSSPTAPETANEAAPAPEEGTYELTATQFQSSSMTLGKMEKQAFHEVVSAKGMIDVPPANRAEVSSYFGGTVKQLSLLPGERVRKGQVLFVLENPDYVQMQQDFLEAQGQLAYLKSDYERQKNLARDSVSSQKKFLKAEADYAVTQARMASLSKKLALMNIKPETLTLDNIRTTIAVHAPISGYVTEVAIAQGTFLTPTQPAVKIVNTDHIHLELNVFEKDLAKLNIGQPIQFRIQEEDSKAYQATIHLINKTIDPEKRTVGIHGHLVDEKLAQRLNPGMYVEAAIYITSEERWALPKTAIVDVEGRFYALTLESRSDTGYTLVKKEVKTGLSSNDHLEILNTQDFGENTEFLVNGAFNLITE